MRGEKPPEILEHLPANLAKKSHWLKQVRDLYAELDKNNNLEVTQLEDELKQKGLVLAKCKYYNKLEHGLLQSKQTALVKKVEKQYQKGYRGIQQK